MDKKSKNRILVLLIVSFSLFVAYSLLGIGIVAEDYYSYYYGNKYNYTYYYISLYNWRMSGAIFVPIIGGFFIILLVFTILFYNDKLRFIKIHKIMSAFDFFAIFGCALAQAILMFTGASYLYPLGIFVNLIIWGVVGVSLAAFIVCIVDFCKLLKTNIAEKRKIKTIKMDSQEAVEKLRMLKQLLDDNIITNEEYEEKKKKYVDLL